MSTNALTFNSTSSEDLSFTNGLDLSSIPSIISNYKKIRNAIDSYLTLAEEYANKAYTMSSSEKEMYVKQMEKLTYHGVDTALVHTVIAMEELNYEYENDIIRKMDEEEEDKEYNSYFEEVFPDDVSPAKNKVRSRQSTDKSPSGSPKPKRRPRRHTDDEKMKQHKTKVAISKARLVRSTEPIIDNFESSSEFRENDNTHLVESRCVLCLDILFNVPEWDTEMTVCRDCCVEFRNEAESRIQGVNDKLIVLNDAFSNCEAYLKRGCEEDRIYTNIEMNNIGEEIKHYQDLVKLYNRILNPPSVIIV